MYSYLSFEHKGDDFFYLERHGGLSNPKIKLKDWLQLQSRMGRDIEPNRVSRITIQNEKILYESIQGIPDYTDANSTGSKGVVYHYELPEGFYYVVRRSNYRKVHRDFFISANGELVATTYQEGIKWLTRNT